jgi:hypothetical protein
VLFIRLNQEDAPGEIALEVVTDLEGPVPSKLIDLEELDMHIQALRVSVAAGKLSLPFAVSGIESILDGSLVTRDFPVWMSLDALEHLQTCMELRQYKRAVESAEKKLSFGRWLLNESFWNHELEVYGLTPRNGSVVRVRPVDLGFKGYRKLSLSRVYARALELGLHPCPPKIVYYLRLAYLEQPVGEWLLAATPPIRDFELRQIQLLLGRGPNQGADCETEVFHLACRNHDLHTVISPDQEIIFMKA